MPKAKLLRQVPCPKCRKIGRDSKGNHLSIYADGYEICYQVHGILVRGNKPNQRSFFYNQETRSVMKTSEDERITGIQETLTSDAYKFLWQYQINSDTVEELKLQAVTNGTYERQDKKVFIRSGLLVPITSTDDKEAFLVRQFNVDPRYKVVSSVNASHMELLHNNSTLVIVEDVFSCMKLYQSGYSSIALLGTHMKDSTYNRVLKLINYQKLTNIILWLDNDTAGIKGTNNLLDRLGGVINTRFHQTEKDPKWYSRNDINKIIECSLTTNICKL